MTRQLHKWAFLQPEFSRHLSEYYAGILDFLRNHPEIVLECFGYDEQDAERLAQIEGFITYAVPPKELLKRVNALARRHPPAVAITMCDKVPVNFARAYIDPFDVAGKVFEKLRQRHCSCYAFCTSHTPYLKQESARLFAAFRQVAEARGGGRTHIFRTTITSDINLIPNEMARFVTWFKKLPRPCGIFVHGDDVAKKMLDTCRLFGIEVPAELRVVGAGNSAIYCERTIPTLTSYGVNHEKVGAQAAQALYEMIHDGVSPQEASFEVTIPDVVERASTLDIRGIGRLCDQARSFIHDEIEHGRAPSIDDIAVHLGVSRAKIQKDFSQMYGHTLHDEIANCRLDRLARFLRASNESAKFLLLRAGFKSVSQAKRAFHARFGMTMSQYRAAETPSPAQ